MSGFRAVHIKRFKNIHDAPFDLRDINVIVGANNSGKSSILQAIHFAIGAVQSLKLDGRLIGQGAITSTINPSKLIYVPSEDVHALGYGGRLYEPRNYAVTINLSLDTGEVLEVSMRKGRNRNIQIIVSDVAIATGLANLKEPFTIFTPGLAGIAKSEQYVSDGVLLRTIARGDANLVLRNTLFRLWESRINERKWDEFVDDLRKIFPNINVLVSFDPETDEFIKVTIRSGAGDIPLELGGTGVLQTIQILSYIHCFNPRVIVIDEPDSHLHPNNQRRLCSLLRDIAQTRNIQVIISTHSRHVIDALQESANFLWTRKGTVNPADGSELAILLDIGALDVKERIGSGAHVCVVLTEDEKTLSLKTILESSGFDMGQTKVLPYNGCTSPHNLRPLIKFIKEVNQQAVIVVHRDRDYHTNEEITNWETIIRSMEAEPFVTEGVDIESHFLKAEHLATMNQQLTIDAARDLIERSMRETRDQSISKYVNGRCDIEKKAGTFREVNVGELATLAPRLYDGNPERYRHSKTVMAKARELFHQEYNINLRSDQIDNRIAFPSLATVAQRAFRRTSS
jgi:ABC-type branched-subunit amino acid transport system ATPase component